MDKNIKRKWVRALKGQSKTKYKQTVCGLKDSDGFCCLGVLCDVIDPSKWIPIDCNDPTEVGYGHVKTTAALPTKLRQSIGLSKREESQLIDLNDNKGFSFKQIAEYISKNIKGE